MLARDQVGVPRASSTNSGRRWVGDAVVDRAAATLPLDETRSAQDAERVSGRPLSRA
jgi:hypothetical protein